MYGRQAEVACLEELFDDVVRDGRPALALVEGDAGIGKTRTVDELTRSVRGKGADVLVGGCLDVAREVLPYAPLIELLNDLVLRDGPASVAKRAGPTAGELARLVPAIGSDDATMRTTPASATRLFQALCTLVEGLARTRPLVLVIEDVQWADPSTRDLLTLLVHQLRGTIMVVLTLRTEERNDDPLVQRFTAVVTRRADRHVVLEPLTRDEQARQMGDILGVPPTTQLVDEVYSRADGNPFFAEELLALESRADVPAGVRELLLARLESLAPGTRQVLRAAALVGVRVPHRLLDKVSDVRGQALDDALRPAVERHVLVLDDAAGGSYRFRHALLQESIAATCLPGESARLHGRIAQAMTEDPTLAGDTRFVTGRIAGHWFAAGDAQRALEVSLAAAVEAELGLGFSHALAHYKRALALLDVVPDADSLLGRPRYQLFWSAAETAYLAGDPELASELARQAISFVDPARVDHHAFLFERLGRYRWMAADGRAALDAYEHSMDLVRDQPVSRWRASIFSGYSQVLMLAGRFAESLPFAREAIAMAATLEDAREIEGHARNNLGVDLALLGHPEEGIAELVEARRIAEEQFNDVDDIGRAIVNLNSVLLDSGRLREAAEVALEGVPVVDGLGLRRRKGVWCRCDAAQALLLLGHNEEALALVREAAELSPDGIDAVRTDMVLGQVLLRTGELIGARKHLERARGLGARILDGQINGPLYAALVETAVWQGELTTALGLAQEGLGRLSATEDAAYSMMFFAAAASATTEDAMAARRRTGARSEVAIAAVDAWVSLAEQTLDRSPAPSPVVIAHLQAARCELARVQAVSDPRAWSELAAAWEEVGDVYCAALAGRREAEALLSGDRRDRSGAEKALRQAWRTACSVGAAHLRSDLEGLARRARIGLSEDEQRVSEAKAPFRLTAREEEVLQHVAAGMTDRQIGGRLFISHRTVERHVSNLLSKLGASRRAELVAIAPQYVLLREATEPGWAARRGWSD